LLLADVHGWAFDVNLRDMAERLKDRFDFDFWYVEDNDPWPDTPENNYDIIYTPYLRWSGVNKKLDCSKAVGSLRSRWFYPEKPEIPGTKEFELVNHFMGFHVNTKENYDELSAHCPNMIYLTNPINMNRFPVPTPQQKKLVVSWNGNARHVNASGVDVKGFYDLVQPACKAARVPLEYAEYNTKRLAPGEMPAFYQKSNVALSVSLYEGASNSVMEAMASGLALITTDVGNHREMRDSQLDHLGDTGIVLVERNLDAIVEALIQLKKNPKRVSAMGALNRQEISERWSWEAWADRYADFLMRGLE